MKNTRQNLIVYFVVTQLLHIFKAFSTRVTEIGSLIAMSVHVEVEQLFLNSFISTDIAAE